MMDRDNKVSSGSTPKVDWSERMIEGIRCHRDPGPTPKVDWSERMDRGNKVLSGSGPGPTPKADWNRRRKKKDQGYAVLVHNYRRPSTHVPHWLCEHQHHVYHHHPVESSKRAWCCATSEHDTRDDVVARNT